MIACAVKGSPFPARDTVLRYQPDIRMFQSNVDVKDPGFHASYCIDCGSIAWRMLSSLRHGGAAL